eukprot:1161263-Pelagomonas_calceolata.AAC.28
MPPREHKAAAAATAAAAAATEIPRLELLRMSRAKVLPLLARRTAKLSWAAAQLHKRSECLERVDWQCVPWIPGSLGCGQSAGGEPAPVWGMGLMCEKRKLLHLNMEVLS